MCKRHGSVTWAFQVTLDLHTFTEARPYRAGTVAHLPSAMRDTSIEYVQLCISEKPTGRLAWVKARRGTAEALGWTEHFKSVFQHRAEQHPKGLVYVRGKGSDRGRGGRRIQLGAGRDNHRPGPGERRQFKVGTTCTLFDLAELFHFTEGDWEWMSTPTGVKKTACEWESIYNAARF